jgi:acetyl-CoA carboxylase carboxyl transferase subunit alpha
MASAGDAVARALSEFRDLDRDAVRRQRRDKFLAIGRSLE